MEVRPKSDKFGVYLPVVNSLDRSPQEYTLLVSRRRDVLRRHLLLQKRQYDANASATLGTIIGGCSC